MGRVTRAAAALAVAGGTTAWLGTAPASAEVPYQESREFSHVRAGQPFTCEVVGRGSLEYENGTSEVFVSTTVQDANEAPCRPFDVQVVAHYRVSGDDQVRTFYGRGHDATAAAAFSEIDGQVIDLDVDHVVTWFCDGPRVPDLCTSRFTVNAK
jgi:hypothetical protein